MRISDWSSDVCSSDLVLLIAATLSDDEAADERRDARVDVDDGAAREVERAPAENQPGRGVAAAQLPDHMRDREIDDRQPDDREDHNRRAFHATDDPAQPPRHRSRKSGGGGKRGAG